MPVSLGSLAMIDCVLCQLQSGEAPGRIFFRDAFTFAFFAREAEVRGHTVVAPVTHVASWSELDPGLVRSLFLATQEVSRRLCARLLADSVNVLFAGGPAAQQSIPHFHVHVLPRWKGDDVDAWPRLPGYTGDVQADFDALTA
jgi:histidine triad (HIT) family protein